MAAKKVTEKKKVSRQKATPPSAKDVARQELREELRALLREEMPALLREHLTIQVDAGNHGYGGPYIKVQLLYEGETFAECETSVPKHDWYYE